MGISRVPFTQHLGRNIGLLLADPLFVGWSVKRSEDDEARPKKEIWYEFDGRGVAVICDDDERVRSIFLHEGAGDLVSGLQFSLTRDQAIERLGSPERSGIAVRLPGIGEKGPWDRFIFEDGAVHLQYRVDDGSIEMITLMRLDVVPR